MIVWLTALALLAIPSLDKGPAYWGHIDSAPAYEIAGGKAIATLINEGPAYMGILVGKPGLKVAPHKHPKQIEMIYVLEGVGFMTIAGRRQRVRPGMAIQVPMGVEHSFEIPADRKETFRAVQVYTPSGPEQRFKKGRRLL